MLKCSATLLLLPCLAFANGPGLPDAGLGARARLGTIAHKLDASEASARRIREKLPAKGAGDFERRLHAEELNLAAQRATLKTLTEALAASPGAPSTALEKQVIDLDEEGLLVRARLLLMLESVRGG